MNIICRGYGYRAAIICRGYGTGIQIFQEVIDFILYIRRLKKFEAEICRLKKFEVKICRLKQFILKLF